MYPNSIYVGPNVPITIWVHGPLGFWLLGLLLLLHVLTSTTVRARIVLPTPLSTFVLCHGCVCVGRIDDALVFRI